MNLIDFFELIVKKIAGIDTFANDNSGLSMQNPVLQFLLSKTVTTIFFALLALAVVLLIVLTIVAIVKAEYAEKMLEGLGVDAIGINCSTGPMEMVEPVKKMLEYSTVPIIAKPNAGLPSLDEAGNTVYNMDADTFAYHMIALVQAGARILGGCCGTTPEFIRKTVASTKNVELPKKIRAASGLRYLTSERKTISFSFDFVL